VSEHLDIGHVPTSDIVASLRVPTSHKTLFSVPGPFYPDLSPQPPGRPFAWNAPGHYGRSTVVPVALVAAQRLQDLQRERDEALERARTACQTLGEALVSLGPENVEQRAVRAVAALEKVTRERDKARAEAARLREAATELLEVADLRGDSDLPHPADDPIDWTARMQDAWDDLRTALKAADNGEGEP
jgi:hypothetical protein